MPFHVALLPVLVLRSKLKQGQRSFQPFWWLKGYIWVCFQLPMIFWDLMRLTLYFLPCKRERDDSHFFNQSSTELYPVAVSYVTGATSLHLHPVFTRALRCLFFFLQHKRQKFLRAPCLIFIVNNMNNMNLLYMRCVKERERVWERTICYCKKQNWSAVKMAIVSWIHSYFDNIMTTFVVNNRTDAWKTNITWP